jgi:hypothetical protein
MRVPGKSIPQLRSISPVFIVLTPSRASNAMLDCVHGHIQGLSPPDLAADRHSAVGFLLLEPSLYILRPHCCLSRPNYLFLPSHRTRIDWVPSSEPVPPSWPRPSASPHHPLGDYSSLNRSTKFTSTLATSAKQSPVGPNRS